MLIGDFKERVRHFRGDLAGVKMETALEDIYTFGVPRIHEFTYSKKLMGIRNIQKIALQTPAVQESFCDWMDTKGWKATKNELDLWAASRGF